MLFHTETSPFALIWSLCFLGVKWLWSSNVIEGPEVSLCPQDTVNKNNIMDAHKSMQLSIYPNPTWIQAEISQELLDERQWNLWSPEDNTSTWLSPLLAPAIDCGEVWHRHSCIHDVTDVKMPDMSEIQVICDVTARAASQRRKHSRGRLCPS